MILVYLQLGNSFPLLLNITLRLKVEKLKPPRPMERKKERIKIVFQ